MTSKSFGWCPLTSKQAVMSSSLLSPFLGIAAIYVSPTDFTHPLWVLAYYFSAYGIIRAATDDFASAKNPELMYSSVVLGLQSIAGAFMVRDVLTDSGGDGSSQALWAICAYGFAFCVGLNLVMTMILLVEHIDQKKQTKIVEAQKEELAAQQAQIEQQRLKSEEEKKQAESALAADLSDFLSESD